MASSLHLKPFVSDAYTDLTNSVSPFVFYFLLHYCNMLLSLFKASINKNLGKKFQGSSIPLNSPASFGFSKKRIIFAKELKLNCSIDREKEIDVSTSALVDDVAECLEEGLFFELRFIICFTLLVFIYLFIFYNHHILQK